jgi:hypothetical protein
MHTGAAERPRDTMKETSAEAWKASEGAVRKKVGYLR